MNAMLNAKAPNKLARIQHMLAETEHRIDEVVGMVYEASNETDLESFVELHTKLKARQATLLEVLEVLNEN